MTGSGSKQMVMEKVTRNSFVKPFCKTILVFKNLHSYLTPQSRLTRDSSGIPVNSLCAMFLRGISRLRREINPL